MSGDIALTPLAYGKYRLIRLMRYLPVTWVSAIGAYFGRREGKKGIRAKRQWVARLHRNLAAFSGIHDVSERERRILDHTSRVGRVYAEFMVLQRLVDSGRVEVVGEEVLATIHQPVMLVGAHLANWELIVHVLERLGHDSVALYLPPQDKVRHRLAVEARLAWRTPLELVPTTGPAMRQLGKAIKHGKSALLFIDEERDGYVSAPNLGRNIEDAGNRWFAARLAATHNLDVVPVHVEPAGNARYRIVVDAPIRFGEGLSELARARAISAELDRRMNEWVKRWIEYWYWLPYFDPDVRRKGC